ncbi:protein phosphatase 1 regulatory subunit 3B-like [Antedon mediterranea]|uniref:protein phosphatase 1 regulatory subunit 3B-like n=1 Tax=Antedon mediterranea TaxID=105859 RepID=UPI003AF4AFAB
MPVESVLLLTSSPTTLSCSSPISTFSNANINRKQVDLNIQMAPLSKTMQTSFESRTNSGPLLRSCLRGHDVPDLLSLKKNKGAATEGKRVRFAQGLALTRVKVMSESSDTPPLLSPLVLEMITQDAVPQPSFTYKYVPCFDQPASNYLQFRKQLEHQNVCLENIVVKDSLIVMGTLKVKNISYEKKVFLRTTFDRWKSFTDFNATFVQSIGSSIHSSESDKFDTFSFQFNVPTNQRIERFEFCVCYKCESGEFWDNNDGLNYRVKAEELGDCANTDENIGLNPYTSLDGNADWSSFSYWRIGEDERPYW